MFSSSYFVSPSRARKGIAVVASLAIGLGITGLSSAAAAKAMDNSLIDLMNVPIVPIKINSDTSAPDTSPGPVATDKTIVIDGHTIDVSNIEIVPIVIDQTTPNIVTTTTTASDQNEWVEVDDNPDTANTAPQGGIPGGSDAGPAAGPEVLGATVSNDTTVVTTRNDEQQLALSGSNTTAMMSLASLLLGLGLGLVWYQMGRHPRSSN